MPVFSKLHVKYIEEHSVWCFLITHMHSQDKRQLYLLLIIVSLLNVSNSSYTLYTHTHTEIYRKKIDSIHTSHHEYCSQDYCLNISSNSSHTHKMNPIKQNIQNINYICFCCFLMVFLAYMSVTWFTGPSSHHRHRQVKFLMSIQSLYLRNMQVHWCTHTHTHSLTPTNTHTCIPPHSHLHSHTSTTLSTLCWPSGPSRTWACL